MLKDDEISGFFSYITNKAEGLRKTAGYSGSWDDGGADVLENYALCWKAGLERQIPPLLQKHVDEFRKATAVSSTPKDVRTAELAELARLNAKYS